MMYLLFFATIFAIFARAPSMAYGTQTWTHTPRSVPGMQARAEPTSPGPWDFGTTTKRPYSVQDMLTMAEPTAPGPWDFGTTTKRPYSVPDMQTMAEPTSPDPCNEDLMSDFVMACGGEYTGEGGEGWCGLEDEILNCMQLQYEEVQCEYPEDIEFRFQEISKDRCHKKNPIVTPADNTQDKQHNWLMVVVLLVPLSLLLLVLLEVARRTTPQVRAATTALTLTSV